MINGIEVEQYTFNGTPEVDYVLIRADVGKMPPHRAKDYLFRLRNELKICKTLDELNIPFDIVGVRDNQKQSNYSENEAISKKVTSNEAFKQLEEIEDGIKKNTSIKWEDKWEARDLTSQNKDSVTLVADVKKLGNENLEYVRNKFKKELKNPSKNNFDDAMKVVGD